MSIHRERLQAAISQLVADCSTSDPEEVRGTAERYVMNGRCFCCGNYADKDDPLSRCYICIGRDHGSEFEP